MKNLISKILALSMLCCAFFIFSGCTRKIKYEYSQADMYVKSNGEALSFESNALSSLEIDWLYGSVNISLVDGIEQISIDESSKKTLKDHQHLYYYLQDGNLKIKYMASSDELVKVGFQKDLIIQVPSSSSVIEKLDITTKSAEVNVSGTTTILYNIDKLNVSSTSGNINLSDLYAKNSKLASESGNIKLRQGWFLRVDAVNQSGGLYVSGVWNNYFMGKAVSGSAVLSFVTTPEDITYQSSSGNVELCLPANKGFSVVYLTRSGKFSSNIDGQFNNGAYVFGDGGKKYEVTTTSGSLKLSKTNA